MIINNNNNNNGLKIKTGYGNQTTTREKDILKIAQLQTRSIRKSINIRNGTCQNRLAILQTQVVPTPHLKGIINNSERSYLFIYLYHYIYIEIFFPFLSIY